MTHGVSLIFGSAMVKKGLLILIIGILAACGSSDNPRKTVEDYLGRIEERDAKSANDLLCNGSSVTPLDQNGFKDVHSVDFRNMKYIRLSDESGSSSIRVTGLVVMEQGNQHVEMTIKTTFLLIAQNDTWCVQQTGLSPIWFDN